MVIVDGKVEEYLPALGVFMVDAEVGGVFFGLQHCKDEEVVALVQEAFDFAEGHALRNCSIWRGSPSPYG